ncbi:MAG: hypothetical protein L0Z53_08440, partial [Acidobacteriales bacterium]|nr:hypothetical protein [Terriglobales bacterium]
MSAVRGIPSSAFFALLVLFSCQSPALEFVLLSQADYSLYRVQIPLGAPVRVGVIPMDTDLVSLVLADSDRVYTFDRTTNQVITLNLHMAGLLSVKGLDQDVLVGRRGFALSPGGVLYGVLPGMQLRTIDAASGTTSTVAPITGAARVEALSFSPDGTLYAAGSLDDNASSETLFTLDTSTGVLSIIGQMNVADLDEMTFARDGFLYGVDSRSAVAAELYRIDPTNGQVINLGSTGVLEATGITAAGESSRIVGARPLPDRSLRLILA